MSTPITAGTQLSVGDVVISKVTVTPWLIEGERYIVVESTRVWDSNDILRIKASTSGDKNGRWSFCASRFTLPNQRDEAL